MSDNIIGKRISELRKKSGENQDDLAKFLKCNRGSVANYEVGKRIPDINTLVKIANHYDTTVDYLAGNSDSSSKNAEVKAVCDYLGLEEESVESIKINHHVMMSADIPVPILICGSEVYPRFYKEVMNEFLQSKCFLDIISTCSYEKILEHSINEIRDIDPQNLRILNDEELFKLSSVVKLVKQYYRQHRLDLFDIQDSVVNFAKSLTDIEQFDKYEVEEKSNDISIVLMQLEEIGKNSNLMGIKKGEHLFDKIISHITDDGLDNIIGAVTPEGILKQLKEKLSSSDKKEE